MKYSREFFRNNLGLSAVLTLAAGLLGYCDSTTNATECREPVKFFSRAEVAVCQGEDDRLYVYGEDGGQFSLPNPHNEEALIAGRQGNRIILLTTDSEDDGPGCVRPIGSGTLE